MDPSSAARRLLVAELVAIGSELTVGDTRDTNGGELARDLTGRGVQVARISAVPDDMDTVTATLTSGLAAADLVVTTGGLGPTPDDLTREAIAAVWGETPTVDPALEAWLRDRFERRGAVFPLVNLKQAWVIPSAEILPNPNGTAPGWLVTRPDGRVVVALPGPPREMRPMWHDLVVPRLEARGLGQRSASRTYRLTGIGESHVAEILGDLLAPGRNPEVATYARVEAVDVRVSARPTGEGDDASADRLLALVAERVEALLGQYTWATGDTTWAGAIEARLGALGWRLALRESGTSGALAGLLGDVPWLPHAERVADTEGGRLETAARDVRRRGSTEVGMAVRARPRGDDTAVSVVIVTPHGVHRERRLAFLTGPMGRTRAGLAAAAILWSVLARESDQRRLASRRRSGSRTTM